MITTSLAFIQMSSPASRQLRDYTPVGIVPATKRRERAFAAPTMICAITSTFRHSEPLMCYRHL